MTIALIIVAGLILYFAVGFGVGYWITMGDDDTRLKSEHEGVRRMFKVCLFIWPIILLCLAYVVVDTGLDDLAQRIIDKKRAAEGSADE